MSALQTISAKGAPTLAPTVETPVRGPAASPPRSLKHVLYLGKSALVDVVPDDQWSGMWRMIWPDDSKSDIANLSRIKDAAATICERNAPGKDRLRFHWEINRGA